MLNFIFWLSNIIFLLCMHVLERRKKNQISAARKGNARKEGQVFESGDAPSPCPRQHSLSCCCTGCACGAPCPCWGQDLSLALLAPRHWHCCLLRTAREHKAGAVSAGLVLYYSSLLRAWRWCSSGACGREQRGWGPTARSLGSSHLVVRCLHVGCIQWRR